MQRKNQLLFSVVLLIGLLFTITTSLQAQVPRTISFQGLLTNPDGSTLPDGTVSLDFMLYESETGGTAIWTETQTVNTKNSIFSAVLGKVTPLTAAFDKPYWVGIKVNGNNELVPRIALTASPYSLGGTATVTEPQPGQNFQIKDSSGIATHIINSNGDSWSVGTGTFKTGLVVGDTTTPSTIKQANKVKFGINASKPAATVHGYIVIDEGSLVSTGKPVFSHIDNSKIITDVYSIVHPGLGGYDMVFDNGAGIEVGLNTGGHAMIDPDALNITTSDNTSVWKVNPDGTSNQTGLATFNTGLKVLITNGGDVTINSTGADVIKVSNSTARFWGVSPDGSQTQQGSWKYMGPTGNDVIIGGGGNDIIDVKDPSNNSVWKVNKDGTTTQTGKATLPGGWSTTLNNGNTAELSPIDGWHIKDASGNFLAHNDANGNAFFAGDVTVNGNLYKGGGTFKIDHPLDPLNKYLYHSFVESPDMMNVYNGNIILNENGEATIELPDWFDALNKDFRYQLTPIGAPGPNLYVSQEIDDNAFKIAGGKTGMKVSWQVTGIRHDAYANLHRVKVEEEKPIAERGKYLHPDAFKQSVVNNK